MGYILDAERGTVTEGQRTGLHGASLSRAGKGFALVVLCLGRSRLDPLRNTMASQAPRLASLITPTYVRLINSQLVHPADSLAVKPSELLSSLARPLQTSHYEPERQPSYLAATLSYGLIKGHPFMDGNKVSQ